MTAFSSTPYLGALLLAGLPLLAPAAVAAQTELWVDPEGGSDRIGNGRPAFPVKTISRALELAGPNTVIRLEAGTYGAGEKFPLVLPPTVSLQGNPRDRRSSVTISGGGWFDAAEAEIDAGTVSSQHAAIVAVGAGDIRNLTISNPQGIGVWIIGNGNVSIRDNTFRDSRETGLAIATAGTPVVQNNTFTGHSKRALSIEGSSSARIVANTFEQNGTGIWVGGVSIPTLQSNRLQGNRIGIEIDGITRPTLQGNQIENSLTAGIEVKSRTRPNFGGAGTPGDNVISGSSTPILGIDAEAFAAAGNYLNGSPNPIAPPQEVATAAVAPIPIPVSPPVAPPRAGDRLPVPVEKFRSPPPRPAASSRVASRDGAIAIPVPAPANDTISPPLPPQIIQPTQEVAALQPPPGSIPATVVPVPAAPIPSRGPVGGVRVLVEAVSFVDRERVLALVPEAIESSYQGRSVMQVGVFASQENVSEIRQRLERFGFSVLVIPR